jgi:cytochrome P450
MTMADVVAPFIAAALAGTLALLVLRNRSRHSLPLPPGPRPLPLIGNLLDVPKEKDWLTYRAWNDQYGDIVYINALGQKVVVLGSAQAVNDLLEQRGSIYSDRPTTPMGDLCVFFFICGRGDIQLTMWRPDRMKFEWSFVVLPYGDMWRRKRKLMTAHLHAGVAERYHPVQLASARRFARDILATGKSIESLRPAVSLFVGQLIMKAVYGIDVEHAESEYITYPEKLFEDFSIACTPGRFMVDFLPFC